MNLQARKTESTNTNEEFVIKGVPTGKICQIRSYSSQTKQSTRYVDSLEKNYITFTEYLFACYCVLLYLKL